MPLMSKPLRALVFSSVSLRKTPLGLMPNDIMAAAASPEAMMRVGFRSAVYVFPSPDLYDQPEPPDSSAAVEPHAVRVRAAATVAARIRDRENIRAA